MRFGHISGCGRRRAHREMALTVYSPRPADTNLQVSTPINAAKHLGSLASYLWEHRSSLISGARKLWDYLPSVKASAPVVVTASKPSRKQRQARRNERALARIPAGASANVSLTTGDLPMNLSGNYYHMGMQVQRRGEKSCRVVVRRPISGSIIGAAAYVPTIAFTDAPFLTDDTTAGDPLATGPALPLHPYALDLNSFQGPVNDIGDYTGEYSGYAMYNIRYVKFTFVHFNGADNAGAYAAGIAPNPDAIFTCDGGSVAVDGLPTADRILGLDCSTIATYRGIATVEYIAPPDQPWKYIEPQAGPTAGATTDQNERLSNFRNCFQGWLFTAVIQPSFVGTTANPGAQGMIIAESVIDYKGDNFLNWDPHFVSLRVTPEEAKAFRAQRALLRANERLNSLTPIAEEREHAARAAAGAPPPTTGRASVARRP